jgi:hypothetical protein
VPLCERHLDFVPWRGLLLAFGVFLAFVGLGVGACVLLAWFDLVLLAVLVTAESVLLGVAVPLLLRRPSVRCAYWIDKQVRLTGVSSRFIRELQTMRAVTA